MTDKILKDLIKAGVRNLHEYGYPECNAENILTDPIYSSFFVSMLKSNMGVRSDLDDIIVALVKEIEGG